MSLFVLDTDILTLYYRGDPIVVRRVDARPPAELAISVLTVDEQLTGWYTLTRQARQPEEIARAYAQLGEAVVRLARWRILPTPLTVAAFVRKSLAGLGFGFSGRLKLPKS